MLVTFKGECLLQNQKCGNLLVINDSQTLNTLLKLVLEAEGFSVSLAETGHDGLKEANSRQYKLILLDYNLPDINGLDVCIKLKNEERTKNTPIAFITAIDKDDILEKIKNVGADAYIEAPYTGDIFINRINKLTN
jgi:DNA-binding response OmpR family regulator